MIRRGGFAWILFLVLMLPRAGLAQDPLTDWIFCGTHAMHPEIPQYTEQAIQYCSRAIESGKLDKEKLYTAFTNRAKAWFNGKQYDRAVADATSALNLKAKKDPSLYVARGSYRRAAGKLDDALADLDQALKFSPNDFEALFYRAGVWREKGNLPAAISDIGRAIAINPLNGAALSNRCYLLLKAGDLKKALADCDSAISLNPKSEPALATRCAVKLSLGDTDGAMADCNAVLGYNSQSIGALVDRGTIWEKQGRSDLAAADYKAAARIKPEDDDDKAEQASANARLAALEQRGTTDAAVANSGPPATVTTPTPAVAALPSAAEPKAAVAASTSQRIALVIGNSAYRSVPPLANPVRDAAVIAEQFRRSGFKAVTLAQDLTRDGLVEALRKFSVEAENADWAVVYYAGHGIEVGGLNYLIPVDAKLASDRAVLYETIPLEQATSAVEGARKLRLVILDACRDNPFAQQMKQTVASRSIGRGMGSVEPEAGTLVVYSAKHGQIALDGDEGNSPFVTALAKRMMTPNLDIRRMFDFVRDDVMEATQRRQQPFSYGSLPGKEDFYFTAAK